ncbi:hypothetical protein LTR91_007918 [Friedmanniomyces endolithicus]|nr:hypothetical protein LTR35_003033 [Friedmanniomyces endolithicus]KAK0300404.1 hypothetical protein LTS00_000658 [Friedmanniomyces endolithicus]KAK0316275.1 hypothetical protein LTR01_000021 [Friedmanniomyces endolithicus]KAK0834450.1 hypothetical protein LTR73_000737 [Friedmanniomyces endolithicus]KAK0993564.1 hypothetical protein LTR91_007918 [Friedmanniomyces endolithicus]
MATNFAPYQSSPDESNHAESPPTQSQLSNSSMADPWAAARAQRLPSPSRYTDDDDETTPALPGEGGYQDIESQRFRNDYIGPTALAGTGPPPNNASLGNVYETSLGIPLGYEALIAYLCLPPAGGMVLLLFEHKNDYVRFHAWQSALLFSALFLVHIIFSWTKVVSYMLLTVDLLLIGWLGFSAWRNSDTLERVEVPFFGRLASSFVDDE